MLRLSLVLAFATLLGKVAGACPTGLRPFNKNLGKKPTCVLEGTYTGSLELSSGFNYILLGAVYIGQEIRDSDSNLVGDVLPGTLTVFEGVKIFALNPKNDTTGVWDGFADKKGGTVAGDIKSFLSVTRDSKIYINGKAGAPVVMTSAQGEHLAEVGAVKAPGNWGGLVISGKAKTNKCTDFSNCTVQGEAKTGWYGGNDDGHSSGSIQYLQVEYGGDRIDAKKELNGVTFNSVGLGTAIDNVAVLYNSDDCIEFFGGAVVATHIFCYKGWDDGIDTTDGARVFLQHGVVVADEYPEAGADNDRHMIEAGSAKAEAANMRLRSHPVFANFTFIGGVNSQGFMAKEGTDIKILNSAMYGVDLWCLNDETANLVEINTNVLSGCGASDPVMAMVNNEFVPGFAAKMNMWIPMAGSILLTGGMIYDEGEFSDDELLDEIFYDAYDDVEYRGAVGSTDWTDWIQIK